MKEALNEDMRQRVLQALAQRAERLPSGGLHDALREALRQRHARWAARGTTGQPTVNSSAAAPAQRRGAAALAELLAGLPPPRDTPGLLHSQRRDWAALRLERRLAEAPAPRDAVPVQIGPLNAQALLPRALQRLRELSPDYLQRLLEQVDALAALSPAEPAEARKGRGSRRR